MTEPGFEVITDAGVKLLHLRLWGFWDDATFDAFEQALDKGLADLAAAGVRKGEILSLVDVRDSAVQSREIAARGQERMQRTGEWFRRGAVLVAGALQKMQTNRAAPADHRQFQSMTEAKAWLLDDTER